jgi:endonuclease-3 related protein
LPKRRNAGRNDLAAVYERLLARQGHSGWWPGESAFEVCLGAILTQNTAWTNAARALDALRAEGLLTFSALASSTESRLAELIRPSGTYRLKAARVRTFLQFLAREYDGRVEAMAGEEPGELRRKLLAVRGIGEETADAIALYAAGRPLFVVDAYTRRVFARLGFLRGPESYADVQRFFMDRLPPDAALFQDYHAQVVRLAKDVCRPAPRCGECALEGMCATAEAEHGPRRLVRGGKAVRAARGRRAGVRSARPPS